MRWQKQRHTQRAKVENVENTQNTAKVVVHEYKHRSHCLRFSSVSLLNSFNVKHVVLFEIWKQNYKRMWKDHKWELHWSGSVNLPSFIGKDEAEQSLKVLHQLLLRCNVNVVQVNLYWQQNIWFLPTQSDWLLQSLWFIYFLFRELQALHQLDVFRPPGAKKQNKELLFYPVRCWFI